MTDPVFPVQVRAGIKADVTEASTILSKGIASRLSRLFNPVCGKREADIERYRILARAQTFREACEIFQETRHLLPASFSQNGKNRESSDFDPIRPMMKENEKKPAGQFGDGIRENSVRTGYT